MTKTKILIIGMGQLGRCIEEYIRNANQDLHDRVMFDFAARTPEKLEFPCLKLDITDYNSVRALLESQHYNFVVNCAAYTNVNEAEADGLEESLAVNFFAVEALAQICKDTNTKLIHISTDYVFCSNTINYEIPAFKSIPEQIMNQAQCYGLHKFQGEQAILERMGSPRIFISDEDKANEVLPYMIIRTAGVYSQYGKNFVRTMCRKFKNNDDAQVVYDNVGSPTNANDLAKFIINDVIFNDATGVIPFNGGVFHYVNHGVISWYDFAQEILDQYKNYIGETSAIVKPIDNSELNEILFALDTINAMRPTASILSTREAESKYKIQIPYWKASLIDFMKTYHNII